MSLPRDRAAVGLPVAQHADAGDGARLPRDVPARGDEPLARGAARRGRSSCSARRGSTARGSRTTSRAERLPGVLFRPVELRPDLGQARRRPLPRRRAPRHRPATRFRPFRTGLAAVLARARARTRRGSRGGPSRTSSCRAILAFDLLCGSSREREAIEAGATLVRARAPARSPRSARSRAAARPTSATKAEVRSSRRVERAHRTRERQLRKRRPARARVRAVRARAGGPGLLPRGAGRGRGRGARAAGGRVAATRRSRRATASSSPRCAAPSSARSRRRRDPLDGRVVRVASRACPEYESGRCPRKQVDLLEGWIGCLVHDQADLSREDIANASLLFHGNSAERRARPDRPALLRHAGPPPLARARRSSAHLRHRRGDRARARAHRLLRRRAPSCGRTGCASAPPGR